MSVDWNDSDSSVDSVCSSHSNSSGDPDWPSHTGFEVHVMVTICMQSTCSMCTSFTAPDTKPHSYCSTPLNPNPASTLPVPSPLHHSLCKFFYHTRGTNTPLREFQHMDFPSFSVPSLLLSSHRSAVPCGQPHSPQTCCPGGDTDEPVSAASLRRSPCPWYLPRRRVSSGVCLSWQAQ